jgi:hypothetical protein
MEENKEMLNQEVNVGAMRLRLEIECPTEITRILKEIFGPQINKGKGLFLPNPNPPAIAGPEGLTSNENQLREREDVTKGAWGKRFCVAVALVIFVAVSMIAFKSYSENHRKQALQSSNHGMKMKKAEAYNAVLSQNAGELFERLEELTSFSVRFQNAYPGVTAMVAIAMHKRGPELFKKAEEAKGFILITKKNFDEWTTGFGDRPEQVKPRQEDINAFLHIWKKTEPLLERLREAQQNPLNYLIKQATPSTSIVKTQL